MKLAAPQVEQFWQDGFLIVENLLDEQELATLRAHADWVASGQATHIAADRLQVEPGVAAGQAQATTYADSLRKMSHLAFSDPIFATHARNPKILDVIESLLGPG